MERKKGVRKGKGKGPNTVYQILDVLKVNPKVCAAEVHQQIELQNSERCAESIQNVCKVLDLFVSEGVIASYEETIPYDDDDMHGRDIIMKRYYPDTDTYQNFYIQVKSSEDGITKFRNRTQSYLNSHMLKGKRNVDYRLKVIKIILINGQSSPENIQQKLIDGILAIERHHKYL